MLAFIIGTLFGMMLGMVLNHAIEEAERKRSEVRALTELIAHMAQPSEGNDYRDN